MNAAAIAQSGSQKSTAQNHSYRLPSRHGGNLGSMIRCLAHVYLLRQCHNFVASQSLLLVAISNLQGPPVNHAYLGSG